MIQTGLRYIPLLKERQNELNKKLITPEQIEMRKQGILRMCEMATAIGIDKDTPLDVKQRLIKQVVKKIVVNAQSRTLQLEGPIRGTFPIVSTSRVR